jgi:hypothetical protein
MDDQEESREEWEKELIDSQRGVTPAEGLRAGQIFAKKLSATPAPIPDFAHLVMLVLSGTFIGIAFLVFSSDISRKTALGVAALATGCCLGVAAFRRHRQRG